MVLVIGVEAVQQMGGTDDEIKGPGFLIISKIGHQMLLETEFHAKEQLDPAFIEGFDPLKFFIIRSGIQVKADIVSPRPDNPRPDDR